MTGEDTLHAVGLELRLPLIELVAPDADLGHRLLRDDVRSVRRSECYEGLQTAQKEVHNCRQAVARTRGLETQNQSRDSGPGVSTECRRLWRRWIVKRAHARNADPSRPRKSFARSTSDIGHDTRRSSVVRAVLRS